MRQRSQRRARHSIAAASFVALGLLTLCAPSALAARRPSLSWSLPHAVSEGAPIPFSWTGSHLGRKHRLVIQRPVGTARTWRTILRLPSNSGSAELPGMALGKYRLRLADLSRRRVLAQRVVGIGVFGQVPFSTLLKDSGRVGVYTTPNNSFPYVTWGEPGNSEAPNTEFTVAHNHCLSAHIAFAPGYQGLASYYNRATVVGTVTLVQESRSPVSATVPFDSIGALDAQLVFGQSWSINTSYEGEFEPLIFINGYAVCDSKESFFS
jgi:hypothetical protein